MKSTFNSSKFQDTNESIGFYSSTVFHLQVFRSTYDRIYHNICRLLPWSCSGSTQFEDHIRQLVHGSHKLNHKFLWLCVFLRLHVPPFRGSPKKCGAHISQCLPVVLFAQDAQTSWVNGNPTDVLLHVECPLHWHSEILISKHNILFLLGQ